MWLATVLPPLTGSPDALRELARSLRAAVSALADASGVLSSLPAGTIWDSPAGERFAERAAEVPRRLDDAARRYDGAARILVGLADELAGHQLEVDRANLRHARARGQVQLWSQRRDDAIGAGADAAEVASCDAQVIRALADGTQAQRDHERVMAHWREVDAAAGARLRSLAQDTLVDPWHYTLTVSVSRSAATLGAVAGALPVVRYAPALRAVGVAAAGVGLLSEVTLWLAYRDRDGREILGGVLLSALGTALGILKQGAGALAVRGETGWRGVHLSTTGRLALGAGAHARQRYDRLVDPYRAKPARRTTGSVAGSLELPSGRARPGAAAGSSAGAPLRALLDRTTAQARATVATKRDQWHRATVGGRNAQTMFVVGEAGGAGRAGLATWRGSQAARDQLAPSPEPPAARDVGPGRR